MRKLPPLNAVRAFEVVARSGGIRAATEELFVSQSAISRHITNLESYLESQLFLRRGRRLILTDAGREYLQQLEPALNTIAQASSRAAQTRRPESLKVSTPPSLLLNWLMPKFGSFLEEYPDIEVSWIDRMTLPDDVKGIDCAIEYRIDPSNSLESVPLLQDEIVAMASPGYVSRYAIHSLDDVRGCRLIETERRFVSWDDVLQSHSWRKNQKRLRVELSMHSLEAACQGYGIALANRINASKFIASGELTIPFTIDQKPLPKRPQYFISRPLKAASSDAIANFIAWLTKNVQADITGFQN